MKQKDKNKKHLSRRHALSLLGTTLIFPSAAVAEQDKEGYKPNHSEGSQVFLKPDGTIVKLKSHKRQKIKVIRKHVSNKTLHSWLKLGRVRNKKNSNE